MGQQQQHYRHHHHRIVVLLLIITIMTLITVIIIIIIIIFTIIMFRHGCLQVNTPSVLVYVIFMLSLLLFLLCRHCRAVCFLIWENFQRARLIVHPLVKSACSRQFELEVDQLYPSARHGASTVHLRGCSKIFAVWHLIFGILCRFTSPT